MTRDARKHARSLTGKRGGPWNHNTLDVFDTDAQVSSVGGPCTSSWLWAQNNIRGLNSGYYGVGSSECNMFHITQSNPPLMKEIEDLGKRGYPRETQSQS